MAKKEKREKPAEATEQTPVKEKPVEEAKGGEVKPEEKVQILLKVPASVKDLFQQETDLAFAYKWIEEPTLTAMFNWTVNYYLREGITGYIEQRRKILEQVQNQEVGNSGR